MNESLTLRRHSQPRCRKFTLAYRCASGADQFARRGMAPVASQPGDFAKYLQGELDRWSQVIKDAGIKPE